MRSAGQPTDIDARTEQLIVYNRIARLQAETGKLRDALQTFQDAIARASIPAASSHPEFRLALADAYLGSSNAQAEILVTIGARSRRPASACACMREAADGSRKRAL